MCELPNPPKLNLDDSVALTPPYSLEILAVSFSALYPILVVQLVARLVLVPVDVLELRETRRRLEAGRLLRTAFRLRPFLVFGPFAGRNHL